METIELTSALFGKGLRLDFPTERQLAALAMAWDDGVNHQVSFLRKEKLGKATTVGEYASMLASADLVLPVEAAVVEVVAAVPVSAELATVGSAVISGNSGTFKHIVPVPLHRRVYADLYTPLEKGEVHDLYRTFQPLKTLSLLLLALELRGGSLFILGGKQPSLQSAESHLKSTFPGLKIVGRSCGDYRGSEEEDVMSAIQKAAPDMILVGSLVRGNELWIPRHMHYIRSGIFFYDTFIIEVLAGRV